MKNLKLILLLQAFVFGVLTASANGDCCPDGSAPSYECEDGTMVCDASECPPCTTDNPDPDSTTGYDCDGDGTYDECDLADCPDIIISGPAYVEKGEDVTLTVSVGKADYTWSISSGASYVSDDGSTSDTIIITGDSEGVATIEVSDDNGKTASHDITCFSVELSLTSNSAEDGEEDIAIEIIVEPSSIESEISNIVLEGKNPDGSTTFENPDGAGITIAAESGSVLDWKIEKARWHEDSSLDCATDASYLNSGYDIEGTYDLGGTTYDFEPEIFTVNVLGTTGLAALNSWYRVGQGSSLSSMISVSPPKTQNGVTYYTATVNPSSFNRDMSATAVVTGISTSQFYSQIEDEENHHVQQFESSVDGHIDPALHWSATQVRNSLQGLSLDDTTPLSARLLALDVIEAAVDTEYNNSVNEVISLANANSLRCELESSAKSAVGSTHYLRLECAYTSCQ